MHQHDLNMHKNHLQNLSYNSIADRESEIVSLHLIFITLLKKRNIGTPNILNIIKENDVWCI